MGRMFATVYRVVLVGISLSALVLSIISATSCAFVEFNHQYKDDRRHLLSLDSSSIVGGGGDRSRKLPPSTAMPDDENTAAETTPITSTAFDGTNTTIHANGTLTTAHPNGTLTIAHPNGTVTIAHPNGTTSTSTSTSSSSAISGSTASADGTVTTTASPSPTSAAQSSNSSAVSGGTASTASVGATAIGEAGLFCDGSKSLSITALWGGTFQDVEDKIADASDRNQSEELARNAAIVSAIFGSLILSILAIGSIIGWRCICEGYIVGLVSLAACISQGVTFLFFNSERYCDGDIINEIINQKPCVLGEGGKYSVVALILYAVIMVLVCRLPKDDPYGWCLRNDREPVKSSDPVGDGASPGGGRSGLFGGSKKGNDDADNENTARSGREHDRPNWLSEEKARQEDAENEII